MSDTIRVVIADDHALFRKGVVQTLEEAGLSVAGEAGSAAQALEMAGKELPDILLLDVSMPGESGLEILAKLQAQVPVCRVVILTASEDEDTLFAALRQGAHGYIVKGVSASELVTAVQAVHEGETYVSPGMAGRMLAEMASNGPPTGLPELSAREQEILASIAEGHMNKEIASSLHLSEKTVKHYVTNILTKLQVRNRVEAALKARSLLPPQP